MKKITSILVDDENDAREVLTTLLENFFPEIEIIGEANNVESAYTLINTQQPQLVFLDIQMPKANGFALLKKYEELPFEVIFVTGFDEYAIQAIKFNALDYLLKPVEVKDLREAINKASKRIDFKSKNNVQIINLLQSMDSDIEKRKVAVHVGENVKFLKQDTIMYIESDGRYSNITTQSNERFVLAKGLTEFEDYFGKSSDFIRTHKNTLVNAKHIENYSKGEPCIIEMSNGKNFEVARRKKKEILERLKK